MIATANNGSPDCRQNMVPTVLRAISAAATPTTAFCVGRIVPAVVSDDSEKRKYQWSYVADSLRVRRDYDPWWALIKIPEMIID